MRGAFADMGWFPVANIVVLMAVCHVKYIEKLGAFLSVAVSTATDLISVGNKIADAFCHVQMTMIMAQHLVLSTQSASQPLHRSDKSY